MIKNQSSDTIWINYNKLESFNGSCCYPFDTLDIYIPPYNSAKVLEIAVKDNKQYYTDDWYYLYRININSLVNEESDSIAIDPNVAHYWNYVYAENETSYSLEIADSLF